ncbi:MAG: DUF4271 domain-containing protein [Bacteroidales bacterium]|nr:DUF4271 domain-containing protein [Bacteroidales bacterium]MBK7625895.1 DUF4271 domain-containing protein [Bacteroidales bacterium]
MMIISYPDIQPDTINLCRPNPVANVTFYDSANVITTITTDNVKGFPLVFIEKNKKSEAEAKAALVKHLRSGEELPRKTIDEDWLILVILLGAFLYSLLRNTSKNLLPELSRFFLFRGINDPGSRDIGGIFHWQSTILNLVSFLSISMFAYCIADIRDIIPSGITGILVWLILTGVIILAITLRHITCYITGNISGKREEFHEYLVGIYQSYRYGGVIIFIIVILLLYTSIFPAEVYIFSGIFILGLMYLVRILRLLIIFIKRNISIFYLILYLCALEILPVVISVKYFAGLV